MVTEATPLEVERLKKVSEGDLNNLKEYISLLNGIIANLEEDILSTRQKAKEFMKNGLKENYGHLMERIHETITRIDTCRKCVEECNADLARKEARIKEYSQLLAAR